MALLWLPVTALGAQQPAVASVPIPVALESRLAEATGLHVGDTVAVSTTIHPQGEPAYVAAIYRPRADPATIMRRDYHMRFHLADLQRLLGESDRVDRMGVVLQPGANTDTAVARLNRTAFGYQVMPTAVIASQSSTTFLVVSRFHRAIAIISVLASSVFLLCLMLLKVEERRRDVAVLRFIGISRRTVFLSLLLESGFVAFSGSVIGTGVALLAGAVINQHYASSIEWCHATWTRVKLFPGVGGGRHCYAETMAARFSGPWKALRRLRQAHPGRPALDRPS